MENNTNNTQNTQNTNNTVKTDNTDTNIKVETTTTEHTDSVQNDQLDKAADNNTELLDKLDSIINKRIDGLAKSILKDNGVGDDDIKDLLGKYKSNKAAKAKTASDELEQLKAENASLRKKIMDGDLLISANKHAEKLNIDKKYISQVLKLADLSKATEGDKINEDAFLLSILDKRRHFDSNYLNEIL